MVGRHLPEGQFGGRQCNRDCTVPETGRHFSSDEPKTRARLYGYCFAAVVRVAGRSTQVD